MAQIGNLGKLITFEVSGDKVLTFKTLTQTIGGRWTTQAIIGGKPRSEFLGAEQRRVNLTVFLSAQHGVKPRSTMERIEKAVEKGTPLTLVVGGRKIGTNQWVITSMSETWGTVIRDGALVSANLTLTLAEYV